MSNDGSTMGIGAERALETILGGKDQPEEDEKLTREQVRERLGKVPRLQEIVKRVEEVEEDHGELHFKGPREVLYWQGQRLVADYSGTTDIAARAVLDFLESHPEHEGAPGENEYAPGAFSNWDGNRETAPKPTRIGVYDLMKANGYALDILDLTGFMWGFAYNTARWLRYDGTEANPAIVEVGS